MRSNGDLLDVFSVSLSGEYERPGEDLNERDLSLVWATLAFSTWALICPKFPSFWCTVRAMSSYEQQGLYSSFAKEKNNGILFFL